MTGSKRAVDRRELARHQPPKPSRWPRTERRRDRADAVLARRQPDLTVVLENVHDPHNVSAVLRSCDAVGVLRAHVIYTVDPPPDQAFARTTSASAAKWIEIVRHDTLAGCFKELHAGGFTIVATALAETSTDLYALDLTRPTALVFGNEMRGVSAEALEQADAFVEIPMMGMVESLNISVACAVTLFEAMRQRRLAGGYDAPHIDDAERGRLLEEWLRR